MENTMIVKVTENDIEAALQAVKKSEKVWCCCPVAQAIRRQLTVGRSSPKVEVDSWKFIEIDNQWWNVLPKYHTILAEFIGQFDRGAKVEPVEFEMIKDDK